MFLITLLLRTQAWCREQATAILMWLPQPDLDPRLSKQLSVLRTDGNMIRCKFEQSSPLPGTPYICLLGCMGSFQVEIYLVSLYDLWGLSPAVNERMKPCRGATRGTSLPQGHVHADALPIRYSCTVWDQNQQPVGNGQKTAQCRHASKRLYLNHKGCSFPLWTAPVTKGTNTLLFCYTSWVKRRRESKEKSLFAFV